MSKNGNGEGSIYKDKKGRWRGQVNLPSADGKVRRKYFYGQTRKEVADKVAELMSQIKSNTYVEPCKVTLYEWLCEWLEIYCKPELRMTTYVNYELYIHKHIKDSIGRYRLSELTTAKFQQYYNEKAKNGRLDGKGGMNPKSLRNMHNMLHKALDQAVNMDMMLKNPTTYAVLPKYPKKEMRFFTVEEQKQLQEAIKGDKLEMPILIALYTGVRQGELLGLKWKYVHLDLKGESYIRIVETINRVKNTDPSIPTKTVLVVNRPKTTHSMRTIPLLPNIARRLAEYKAEQECIRKEKGFPYNDYVFTATNGMVLDPRDFQRDYKLLLKRNGIREINVHGLRHTFATRALESGMSPKTLSKILGHSSVGFTLDTYAHVTDELKAEEMAGMNEFL